jgi:predicted RNA-binding Zn-ribbon protein involved in translation (DUF1610 family)
MKQNLIQIGFIGNKTVAQKHITNAPIQYHFEYADSGDFNKTIIHDWWNVYCPHCGEEKLIELNFVKKNNTTEYYCYKCKKDFYFDPNNL